MITLEPTLPPALPATEFAAIRGEQRRLLHLVENLQHSDVFRDYQRAFQDATGLPLELHAPDSFQLVHRGGRNESPFCALMAANNKSCSGCLELQRRVRERAAMRTARETETLTCFAGFSEAAVPVRLGEKVLAFLHTGQVSLHRLSERRFQLAARRLRDWGVNLALARKAYFRTRVMTPVQFESNVRLLELFAQHLSLLSNQLAVTASAADSPTIARAKRYLVEHFDEKISLGKIARAVGVSRFYFCKIFRLETGLHFLDFLARTRVERAKQILFNSHARISEAAYAAGFQSLSQFNRIFKRVVGEQPRRWRETIAHGRVARTPPR